MRCAGGGRRASRVPVVSITSSSSEVSLELLLPSWMRFREGRSPSSGGVDFARGGWSTERLTLFLSVASAAGRVVADPECLRRKEEGDTGDEDRSDVIFFNNTRRTRMIGVKGKRLKRSRQRGGVNLRETNLLSHDSRSISHYLE